MEYTGASNGGGEEEEDYGTTCWQNGGLRRHKGRQRG